MQPLDDSALLKQFVANHSNEAFATLVARYVSLVYSVALRRTGNPHHAEEITQAVFIILARKAGRLRHHKVLSSWLFQTTRLTANNFLRSEIRRQHREQEAFMASIPNEAADEAWLQIADLLDPAVAALSEKDRRAIVLRFYEGRNLREVGQSLGASEDAAEKRVSRALQKLRTFFSKRGITLSATLIAGAVSANSVQAAPMGLAGKIAGAAVTGAAVSATTLTLVKGVLSLMAWTKAKAAVVFGAVVILTGVGTVSVVNHFRYAPPHQSGRFKMMPGDVKPMVAYSYSRAAILVATDGSLWSLGVNRLGWPVLGLSDTNVQNTTSWHRIGYDIDWVSIAAGDGNCLGIKSDGTLWGWGENINYQLGDGTKTTQYTPVQCVPGNDWKQVAAGGASSFAIKNDGTLWAWGSNWAGQLGTGDTTTSSRPRQVGSSTNWTKIWAGGSQTVGLQSDGRLWFWGSRSGEDKTTDKILRPTRVSADDEWEDVCFGYFTVFAIKSDGTLWCWGREARFYTQTQDANSGISPKQIGNETDWQSCNSPAGGFYQLLQNKDGSLWAMDASDHRTVKPDSDYKPVEFREIKFKKDIAAYTAGGDNIGIVITTDGEVWTWGMAIGEHGPEDYLDSEGNYLSPKERVILKPWQLSFVDSPD